jgi:hypothetical protein
MSADPPSAGQVGADASREDQPAADPGWRVAHLPMLTAVSAALLLCAASVGMLAGGPAAALGAAAGVAVVTVSYTMSTLVFAWADAVRPALILPLGLLAYTVKYTLLAVIMLAIGSTDWVGGIPMAWGIVAGVVGWTGVQIWWVLRMQRSDGSPSTTPNTNR